MKKILLGLGTKLIKGVPGSGIITEIKSVFDKDKPETWMHLGVYVLGVAAIWIGIAYGLITADNFVKMFKLVF